MQSNVMLQTQTPNMFMQKYEMMQLWLAMLN